MSINYQNWKIQIDNDSIMWLSFDKHDAGVNTICPEVLTELDAIIQDIEENHSLKGLVIQSAKSSGFIAGADVSKFQSLANTSAIRDFIEQGQAVFQRLANLSIPTVALIQGFCLGGGLELALACRYRIATADERCQIGLPEIKLGLLPAWGGTVRLPQLIGAWTAIPMIMAGRVLSNKAAAASGVVNTCVPKRFMQRAARDFVLTPPQKHQPAAWQKLLSNSVMRPLVAKLFQTQLAKKANKAHYPAPYQVLENWRKHGGEGTKAYQAEIDSIMKLFATETAQSLLRVFFLQTRLKGLAKAKDFPAEHVHVIGAGTMGGDIAAWCALSGLNVTLQDTDPTYIASAIKRAHALFTKKLKAPRLVQAAMDRLIPDVNGHGISKADVVIEAVPEDLTIKQTVFKEIEKQLKPTAIMATNTSSIPLEEIAAVLTQPHKLVGIHFFNPLPMMPLVEVVSATSTDPKIANNAMSFVRRLDRLPLPVSSKPGFLVNRILMPYLLESMALIEEGVPANLIDKAAVDFGMPMGPIELSDTVGLDVCLFVADNLMKHFGGTVPERLREMVAEGNLGRKSEKGFYEYRQGKAIKKPITKSNGHNIIAIQNRLILRMIKEAFHCLDEKIVVDRDLLDAGMIFGAGFAPFRGGLMHYSDSIGSEQLKGEFAQLEQQFGERFKYDQALNTEA